MFAKFPALDNLSRSSPFCARSWAKKHSVPAMGKQERAPQAVQSHSAEPACTRTYSLERVSVLLISEQLPARQQHKAALRPPKPNSDPSASPSKPPQDNVFPKSLSGGRRGKPLAQKQRRISPHHPKAELSESVCFSQATTIVNTLLHPAFPSIFNDPSKAKETEGELPWSLQNRPMRELPATVPAEPSQGRP